MGLLRGVWMIWTRVYLEFREHLATKTVLGEHSPYGCLYQTLRVVFPNLRERFCAEPTRISRVPEIQLLNFLVARNMHRGSVENHNVVTTVEVRDKGWFVLTTKDLRYLRGKPAKRHIFCIDDIPRTCNFACFWRVRSLELWLHG